MATDEEIAAGLARIAAAIDKVFRWQNEIRAPVRIVCWYGNLTLLDI